MSLRQESYTRSIWQMIGIIKWYVRLCQKIIRSAFPGSKTSHLCLLPMTSSLFFYLFKMIGLIGSFTKWLSEMGSTNFSLIPVDKSSCLASSPLVSLKDEIEIAKLVFKEIWEDDQKSLLSAELWFIILQDIGRIIIPSSDIDHGSSSNRHSEFFSAPLAATHADQVKESADHFRKVLEKYIKLDVQQGLSEVDEEVEGDDNKEVEKETEDEEIMEYDLINGGLKIDTRVLKFRKNIKKKTVRGEADEEQLKIKLEKEYIKKNYRQCVKCRLQE
ncbi:expressed protein [Phakopsora pachyrhizi]|uniref:Expressed protein n=1 Tax=Phakopsora pachyrhizi TaxID=170000 RepID=A0AAV0AM34_PHAPC|nr:expressed protein [Phakopsora pachyrhizi]